MSDQDPTGAVQKTFTQADIDRAFAAGGYQAREKLKGQYADYDDLKAKASEAEKSRGQLDRIEQQLADQIKRAEAAERQTLIRSVADELGISVRLAGRLQGKTREELLADGRETMEDLGIEPKGTTSGNAAGNGDVGGDGNGSQQQEHTGEPPVPTPEPARRSSRPPREVLQSAAPRTEPPPEETDPLKLAALIPRR